MAEDVSRGSADLHLWRVVPHSSFFCLSGVVSVAPRFKNHRAVESMLLLAHDGHVELQGRGFRREALAVVAGLVAHPTVHALGAKPNPFVHAHLGRNGEASRVDTELL